MENELGLEQVFFFFGLIGLEQVNSSVPSSTTTKKIISILLVPLRILVVV